MSVITTVNISGMTCGHCVASVTEELESLEGIEDISIELKKDGISVATIISEAKLDRAGIGEAVAEAGYLVVAGKA